MTTKAVETSWEARLTLIVDTMRELSEQTDPQAMVRAYASRVRELLPTDGMIALSRRGLEHPQFKITRSTTWEEEVNPWKQPERLPLLDHGLLRDLVYADRPEIIDDLQVDESDPAWAYLQGQRSLVAIPIYDRGQALNMVILLRKNPHAFDREQLPELVWRSNLFGRATFNLVLSEQLKEAYEMVDRELRVVADIQRSLLPAHLPEIPGMGLAAYYQTSHRAGGDYYDVFPLPDNKWGILIADVSGHGTPAAVVMAIMHSIVHTYPGPPSPPSKILEYVNYHMTRRYTSDNATFVTAFYAIYDPQSKKLEYCSAGHNPPRIKRCQDGSLDSLDGAQNLILGMFEDTQFETASYQLTAGDQVIFYTDGIVEAQDPKGDLFGTARLDQALENCFLDADGLINEVVSAVERFVGGHPADDDRTMLVAKIS